MVLHCVWIPAAICLPIVMDFEDFYFTTQLCAFCSFAIRLSASDCCFLFVLFFFLDQSEWLTLPPPLHSMCVFLFACVCFEIGLQMCGDCLFSVLHLLPLPFLDASPWLNSQTLQEHSCSLHHIVFCHVSALNFHPPTFLRVKAVFDHYLPTKLYSSVH